ncbi:uncharacterized protein LOC110653768 isoform X1 [Hevea brasiliensis]|uniref:uncharacterized protein LOC110653768 isoform X1 n=1 Tax=Hevea brasiliensis TaxID=3981 RepID=UPI0025F7FC39|nr:uncharacterized protein LOC110653768 isoform X1 [Hevea brasiliensis]
MALSLSTHRHNIFVLSTSKTIAIGHGRTKSRRADSMVVKLAVAYEEGQLKRPKWGGETPLSRLVGALISFKPLSALLKLGARQVLISTAEKNNIPWREMRREILESDVYKEIESIQNPSIIYPDCDHLNLWHSKFNAFLACIWFLGCRLLIHDVHIFSSIVNFSDYLNPFHAYDEGNLSWLAAAEAEPATMSIARRAMRNASSPEEANQVMRGNWLQAIQQHHLQHSGNSMISDILDIGCSVGVDTRFLADNFPLAKVTGLDLSPYFLSVAQFKEKKRAPRKNPINWVHANGEDTGLPSKSYDLVSIAYVLHECPERAIVNIVREAFRLLRPGGTLALTDQAPESKILQELPPVLFTLLKSTEPFLDEYYLTDLEGRLKDAGFVNIQSVLTSPRDKTVTATVPPLNM